MTITSLDGYRWLKNDIIRGNFQPDEKLRMSLLTSRYALGVGPLREALSQLNHLGFRFCLDHLIQF